METFNNFKGKMAESGFLIDHPVADGQIHRFDVDKTNDRAGWYVLFDGDFPAGVAGSWKTDERIKWSLKSPKTMNKTEKAKYCQKLELAKKLSEQELKRRHAEAKIKALNIWKKANPVLADHPYLKNKKVGCFGLKQVNDDLIIPAVDKTGELWTIQTIKPNGQKRFLSGGKKKECYFKIPGNDVLCIAEGYATGATIHEATGSTVFVAFDAGNVEPVALSVRKKYPNAEITICADNDQWTDGNPGLSKAKEVAMGINGRVVVPEFKNVESKPTDFNDLHVIEGLEVVKHQLENNPDLGEGDKYPEIDKWDNARELFPRIHFPWEVLPVEIAKSLQQLARSHATSPLSLPGAAIAILSSVLGATVNVSPKQSWKEPLIVWFADIRPSGSGKTPAARALCRVLYGSQSQADIERKRQVDEEMEKRPKDRQEVARSRSYFITDLTLEGLRGDIMGHGGSVCVMDELSSFISGQNQYKKKGNDREVWLAIHDGNPARIVRANESMTISGARISLFGGIQPRVWQTCFSGQKGLFLEDGTVYRFLPTFENETFYKLTSESWSDKNRDAWERTLSLAMQYGDEVVLQPDWKAKSLCLSENAQSYFFNWRNDLHAKKTELPDQLKGFLPKISSYALRLSGALYCMNRFAVGSSPGAILSKNDIHKGVKAAEFYMGHIVDAMKALVSKNRIVPFELTEHVKHLAAILESLKTELDNGRLAVGYVQKKFNESLPTGQQIKKAKSMGTLLRQCGLTVPVKKFRIKDKGGLSCLVWDQKLNNFLKKVSQQSQQSQQSLNGGTLQVLTKEKISQHSQHSVSDIDPHVDNVDVENRLSTLVNPSQTRDVDNVDNVDKFFKESKKFTMEL
jgi:phage/plasmid primase-like uncharacterized protein